MAERIIYFKEEKLGERKYYTIATIENNIVTIEHDSMTGSRNHVILQLKTLKEMVSNAESGKDIKLSKPKGG